MGYRFSVEKFKENFNAKDITDKSIDSVRITHRPDGNFQVFPYKATGKAQAPIVTELETVVSGFFREVLKKKTEPIAFLLFISQKNPIAVLNWLVLVLT